MGRTGCGVFDGTKLEEMVEVPRWYSTPPPLPTFFISNGSLKSHQSPVNIESLSLLLSKIDTVYAPRWHLNAILLNSIYSPVQAFHRDMEASP